MTWIIPNCQIYDGDSAYDPLLLMHCGSSLPDPPIIRSSGNQMYIRLKTDGSSSSRGFKANFTTGCGVVTGRSGSSFAVSSSRRAGGRGGVLNSPHWPSIVLPRTNCSWILTAPGPEDHVTFTMTNLDWPWGEGNENCSQSFVQVLDGEDGDAPSLGR